MARNKLFSFCSHLYLARKPAAGNGDHAVAPAVDTRTSLGSLPRPIATIAYHARLTRARASEDASPSFRIVPRGARRVFIPTT